MCGEAFESPYDLIQCCVENPHILKQQDGSIIELKQPVINARHPSRYMGSINNCVMLCTVAIVT